MTIRLLSSMTLMIALVLLAGCGTTEPETQSTATPPPPTTSATRPLPSTVVISPTVATTTPLPPINITPTDTNASGPTLIAINTVDQIELGASFSGHNDKVYTLAFSRDGAHVASVSPDRTIKLWDLQSGQEVHTFGITEVGMNDIAFSPDGKLLASAEAIWDVETGQLLYALDRGIFGPVAFSPNGSLLVAALVDQPIKLWEVASGEVVRTFEKQADNIALDIEFSPDGTLLAVGGHLNGTVTLWEVESGQVVRAFAHDARSNLHGVAFSPDGRLLASASTEGTAKLWDLGSGQVVATLIHGDGIYDVTFSPDGNLLATAGCDRAVKLWEVANGQLVRTLGHADEVMTVAFSPDGTLLASGGYDKIIYFWGIPHGEE